MVSMGVEYLDRGHKHARGAHAEPSRKKKGRLRLNRGAQHRTLRHPSIVATVQARDRWVASKQSATHLLILPGTKGPCEDSLWKSEGHMPLETKGSSLLQRARYPLAINGLEERTIVECSSRVTKKAGPGAIGTGALSLERSFSSRSCQHHIDRRARASF